MRPLHTVAIWTFTFHKISGFVRVVLRPISIKPTGQDYEYFYLKIHIYYTHFPSISCRSCQIHCFLHTVAAISMSWHVWVALWWKNVTPTYLPFWNSSNSVQKAVDLTNPAKNRRKRGIIDMNFQIKKFVILACRLVWNWPSKSPFQSLIICEM